MENKSIIFSPPRIDPNGGRIGGGGVSGSINLHFTVPQQSTTAIGKEEAKPIAKSELWLFPRFDDVPQDQRWYEISLGFVFTLSGFNKPVETQVDGIRWRGADECIMVDLTTQTKIIDRKLKKRNLNETQVNVRVTVHHREEYHGPIPTEQEWQRTCSSLSSRASNNSFLVVKYFSDERPSTEGRKKRQVAYDRPQPIDERPSIEGRKKRRVAYDHPQPIEDSSTEGCSLVSYNVSLQEVFGPWVVSPSELVDVGACAGTCSSNNGNLFTPRSQLKDRLSHSHHSPSVIPNHVFQVNCIAIRSSAMQFLIYMEETNSLVLVNYPIKAKACGCR